MLRSLAAVLLLVFNSGMAAAQATDTSPAPRSGSVPAATFRAQADLVLVDVVVTDQGQAVTGLDATKFHLSEDGKPQAIKVFEEHKPDGLPAAAPAPVLPAHIYGNFPQVRDGGTVNVLLLDALNTPLADQLFVREQMLAYLKKAAPGTRVAIFTLASRLRMVTSFHEEANSAAKLLGGRSGSDVPLPVDSRGDTAFQANVNRTMADGASTISMSTVQQFAQDFRAFKDDERIRITLDAITELAGYLDPLPGRKNLIWFSGSFPLAIDPDVLQNHPELVMANYGLQLRRMADLLSAARVAVYPIEARGLTTTDLTPDGSAAGRIESDGGGQGAIAREQGRLSNAAATQRSMAEIAKETGGSTLMDSNDLKGGTAKAIAHGSHYYTLGYAPAANRYDGAYRHIRVEIDGKYDTAYRHGYFADPPRTRAIDSSIETADVMDASEFSAPPLAGILFKARVIAANDPSLQGAKPEPGPAGDHAKELKGPVRRFMIDYAVDVSGLPRSDGPDGTRELHMETLAIAFDAHGKRINGVDRGMGYKLTPQLAAQVQRGGLPVHQELDLPAGPCYLRLVVHARGTTLLGSTELAVP